MSGNSNVVWPQLSPNEWAFVRSKSGPLSSVPPFSSVPFTAMSIHHVSTLDSDVSVCPCLSSWQEGFCSSVVAQTCREGGARMDCVLFGCQLAIDATVVSFGTHRRRRMPSTDKLWEPHVVLGNGARLGVAVEVGKMVPRNDGVVVVPDMREGRFASVKVAWQRTSSVVQTLWSFFLACSTAKRSLHPWRWRPGVFHQ